MKDIDNRKRKHDVTYSNINSSKKAKRYSELHDAVIKENVKAVRDVLNEAAASVNKSALPDMLQERDALGNTAMHLAMKKGNLKIACQLISKSEDFIELLSIRNSRKLSVFEVALKHKNQDIRCDFISVLELFVHGAQGCTKLHDCIKNFPDNGSDEQLAHELEQILLKAYKIGILKEFLLIKAKKFGNKTALSLLASKCTEQYFIKSIKKLYEYAAIASVNKQMLLEQDVYGDTFLHSLIYNAKNNTVLSVFIQKYDHTAHPLLSYELLNITNETGYTVFDILMMRCQSFEIDLLFSISYALRKTEILLQHLVKHADLQKVEDFIQQANSLGITPKSLITPDEYGNTVLHYAAYRKDSAILKCVLAEIIEHNEFKLLLAKNIINGSTALYFATYSCNLVELVETAQKGGVLKDLLLSRNNNGNTILSNMAITFANQMDEAYAIEIIIGKAHELNILEQLFFSQDDRGYTLFHHAAKYNNWQFLEYIMGNTALVPIEIIKEIMLKTTRMGDMPLHVALLEGSADTMKALLALARICVIEKQMLLAENNDGQNIPILAAANLALQDEIRITIGKSGIMLCSEGICVRGNSR